MTRLKGSAGGISWVRWILILLVVVALVLGLDYVDVLPLHFW
jgi:membrane-anchored protein YejM (alkaline phosphatase superfamily)